MNLKATKASVNNIKIVLAYIGLFFCLLKLFGSYLKTSPNDYCMYLMQIPSLTYTYRSLAIITLCFYAFYSIFEVQKRFFLNFWPYLWCFYLTGTSKSILLRAFLSPLYHLSTKPWPAKSFLVGPQPVKSWAQFYIHYTAPLWKVYTGGPHISWFLVPKGYHEIRGSRILKPFLVLNPKFGPKIF